MHWHDLFVALLKGELERRQKRNPKYSLRQWSKKLGISSGAVSEILGGRRSVTKEKALALVHNARLPEREIKRLRAYMGEPAEVELISPKLEDARMIQDWINHAICGLYELNNAEINTQTISERLGVPLGELERRTLALIERGLLRRDPHGKTFRTKENWNVALILSPSELHQYKRRALEFAGWAMDRVPENEGTFMTYTFPGNKQQLEFARKEIKKLINGLSAMADSEPSDELIRISFQLFPFRFSERESPANR